MKRVQVLFSEDVYSRIKAEAKRREWTVAEVVRRGVEKQLESAVDAPRVKPKITPGNLGVPRVPVSEWRDYANDRGMDALD